ncbi:MAG: PhzF family phenazine biosynthesis protein [Chitinophagales bacterium]
MKLYVVNAFTRVDFGGNPAGVIPLTAWLSDEMMQQMAAQHNLAETGFIVQEADAFRIRWFTPTVEVDLCGHATLATAHIYFSHLNYPGKQILFNSKSGPLPVYRENDGSISLDFPLNRPSKAAILPEILEGLKAKPLAFYSSTFDFLAVFEKQSDIEKLDPDFKILAQVKSRGLITTAKGEDVDFVSRCFFPQSGIDEDPVTGSAYTVLAPYWADQLGKTKLSAIQLSKRKGYLNCELRGERVLINGFAKTYLEGEIFLAQ